MNDCNNMELNPVSNQRSNMDQEEKILKNECVNLKDEVNRIVSRYSSSISGCPAINAQLKKIVNRSKEYSQSVRHLVMSSYAVARACLTS